MNSTTSKARRPQVNDILHASWGYDQTNATFYKVLKVTAARLVVQELHNIETSTGFMHGRAVPDLNRPARPPMTKGFKPSDWYGYSVRVSSYSTAFPWDGQPCDVSHTH